MIEKTACYPKRFNFSQIFQYCFVGSFAALAQFVSFYILINAHIFSVLFDNALAFLLGVLLALLGHTHYTFVNSQEPIRYVVIGFILISVVGFFLNQSIFYLLWHSLHINYFFSLVLTLASVAVITFLVNKMLIFRA